jgi:hypothetical protein
MTNRFGIVLLFLFCATAIFAQQTFSLSGSITDENKQPLFNAVVTSNSIKSITDSSGNFQLNLTSGKHKIAVQHFNSVTKSFEILLQNDTAISLELQPKTLKEVTITQRKQQKTSTHQENGTISISRQNIESLPAFFGERDPMRAVQMQQGVQSGNEGARGLFIRGGGPDQNLLLLDGAPVFNPSHIYGFISVFNSDAIENIDVHKDNYPAQFGGRLASVIDVSTTAGDTSELNGVLSLGLGISRFNLNGPLGKKKQTSFALSLRGCYAGLLTSPISKKQFEASEGGGGIEYYFGDINAKIEHRFSSRAKLAFSFFTNQDIYKFSRKQTDSREGFNEITNKAQSVFWSNYIASGKFTFDINQQWAMTQLVSFSRYQIKFKDDYINEQEYPLNPTLNAYHRYKGNSRQFINDISWRADFNYTKGKHTLTTGTGITAMMFETANGYFEYDRTVTGKYTLSTPGDYTNTIEAFLFAQYQYQITKRLTLAGGLHGRMYHVQQKTFFTALPRFNLVYNPVAKLFLRAAVSGLSQNMHLLTSSSADILNDYWVPAIPDAKPETSWNFSAGITQKLPLNFEWSIDGFYRIMNNMVDYRAGLDQTATLKPWQNQIETNGTGRSYGAEFYLARNLGWVTGSVAYTLAWSERKFATLNQGKYFPYKFDRRHNLAAQLNFLIGKGFEIGIAYVYGSGYRITLPYQYYQTWGSINTFYAVNVPGNNTINGSEVIFLSRGKNNFRLPSFQHLDLSFTYRKQVRKLEHAFNLSIYNVYNHFNIFTVYATYRTNADGSVSLNYKKLSLFPVLPSISYTFSFRK